MAFVPFTIDMMPASAPGDNTWQRIWDSTKNAGFQDDDPVPEDGVRWGWVGPWEDDLGPQLIVGEPEQVPLHSAPETLVRGQQWGCLTYRNAREGGYTFESNSREGIAAFCLIMHNREMFS